MWGVWRIITLPTGRSPDDVGLFTRIDGEVVPLVYPAEPLLGWVNERARAHIG